MKGLPFLDQSRTEQENMKLYGISYSAIVRSAVSEGLLVDDDLATVPEALPLLINLAGELRDDLYRHHQKINKQIQFPLVQKCCGYAFAKGAESAFLWHHSPAGQIRFRYSPEDALMGAAGAQVSIEFAANITKGMAIAGDVFCDFQNLVLIDPSLRLQNDGRLLADVLALGFLSFSQVGLDYGMGKLGFA